MGSYIIDTMIVFRSSLLSVKAVLSIRWVSVMGYKERLDEPNQSIQRTEILQSRDPRDIP